jgi:hypothetical protein
MFATLLHLNSGEALLVTQQCLSRLPDIASLKKQFKQLFTEALKRARKEYFNKPCRKFAKEASTNVTK